MLFIEKNTILRFCVGNRLRRYSDGFLKRKASEAGAALEKMIFVTIGKFKGEAVIYYRNIYLYRKIEGIDVILHVFCAKLHLLFRRFDG